MVQRCRNKPLPSPETILSREKETKKILWDMFYNDEQLRDFPEHLALGLMRLTEKSLMARAMADHMESRGIRSIEELAHRVYLGSDSFDTLGWLRSPTAFSFPRDDSDGKRHREYLLALCGLEWEEGRPVPIPEKRPT